MKLSQLDCIHQSQNFPQHAQTQKLLLRTCCNYHNCQENIKFLKSFKLVHLHPTVLDSKYNRFLILLYSSPEYVHKTVLKEASSFFKTGFTWITTCFPTASSPSVHDLLSCQQTELLRRGPPNIGLMQESSNLLQQ